MSGARVCAHPGCSTPLYPGNRSGVCRAHAHQQACGCWKCERRRGGEPVLCRPPRRYLPPGGTQDDREAVEAARAIEPEADACRALWVAVLHLALEDIDATDRGRTPRCAASEELAARRGFLGSRDFHQVAALAGLDGAAVRDAVEAGRYRPGPLQMHKAIAGDA